MKKQFVLVALIVTVMMTSNLWAGSQPANAGPPFSSKPANVVTVAKSGGDYSSIAAALNSITAASSTNPYIIKVMPGIYNESITMKPYVDVVGSGRENTQITFPATNSPSPSGDYTNATVIGADNSNISDIWIDNSDASDGIPIGILNNTSSMNIDNVKVTVNAPDLEVYGILNNRSAAKIYITNCIISVNVEGNALGVVALHGSDVNVQNCKIEVKGTTPTSNWNAGVTGWYNGKITVRDSTVTSEGAQYNYGIDNEGLDEMIVSNTRAEAIGTSNTRDNAGVWEKGYPTIVTDSKIYMSGSSTGPNCAVSGYSTSMKIGGSLVQGNICRTPKIVNSWDGDFNPIPNQ